DNNIPDDELNELDESWSEIVSQLGESNFTDFIRYHHNFQATLVTKKDLFSSVRKLINTPEKAYEYLRSLSQYAPVYASLLNPHDEWWANQDVVYRDVKKYLEGFDLFNIKQPLTVLMVAFTQFSGEEFVKLSKYLYILAIRYNVICHLSPNEQENAYNQLAIKIHAKECTRASHVKNSDIFRKLYPSDESFFNAFEFHKMPSKRSAKKIRFLLAEIETYLGHETDPTKTTLEHVCPYNPDEDWDSYFGEGVNDIQDRLGNVVLLEKDELKRASFENKKRAYLEAHYPLAQQVASYDKWNLQNLNAFQAWLSNQAVETWKVSYK
ncbi:HNH endonuclease family protein, partial [Methyloglobulus sp.]|uniref:HNH endonuclease family protein n=1 Tax=Methyloglobulus sp. TaxID=2518622 RepID=UPI0032B87AA2